jgi:hypothetical protein
MPVPLPRVTAVKVIPPYSLDITFKDGTQHIINLESELYGEVFEPLRDPAFFTQVFIEGTTVVWPNGADFSPEWLYEQAIAKVS